MKIAHCSDFHGRHREMRASIPPCDVLVVSGDLSMYGESESVLDFLDWLNEQEADHKIFISGNHDITFDNNKNGGSPPGWLTEGLELIMLDGNIHFLENSEVVINGVKFWGSPITPWFHGDRWAFNKHRGPEIKEIWKEIPSDTDVLITHGPPYCKLDFTSYSKEYVGCEELAYRIKEVKPLLHLFGHIHEEYGYAYDENTHYFNSCICDLLYEATRAPQVFTADFTNREIIL